MAKGRRQTARTAAVPPADRQWWAYAAVVVATTVLAFLPAFGAEFLRWDDPQYVSENLLLRSGAGLREIWTPFAGTLPQYYPLTFTSYWIEYQVWQLTPAGYHATNVLLHALNAVLVLWLVSAFGASLWVAFGTAAVFALHPVQVESVMWITERKNTLSGCFFLVAFLLYLRHRRTQRWDAYVTCLVAFVCALLSKTQTVTLPVLICLTEWLLQRNGRLSRLAPAAVVGRVLPMLGLGLLSAWLTAAVERQMTLSWVELPTLLQRLLIAANAPWYYLATFVAPFHLAPIVPKWAVSATAPQWWIGLLAWLVAIVAFLRWRTRMGDMVVWGTAEFFIALLPALGLVPFAYQHYTYAATRFLYLSCVGGGVVLATLGERLAGPLPSGRRSAVTAAGIALLIACGALTAREAARWQTNVGFWTYAVARNPDSYPPNINLGLHYEAAKQWAEALRYYQRAYELRPMDTYALTRYLRAVSSVRGPQAVVEAADAELRRSAVNAYVAHLYRGMAYEKLGRRTEALADYDQVLALTRQGSNTWQAARQGRDRLAPAATP